MLLLLLIPTQLIAEDNRVSQVQRFDGLANCIAVTNTDEIIVASDDGLYSLTRGRMTTQPIDAVASVGTTLFTISADAKFQRRDSAGAVLDEFQLDLLPDQSEECIYPGLTEHFFLYNIGIYVGSGLWKIVVPGESYEFFQLPQDVYGRRLRGLAYHDGCFWVAKKTRQKIYKLRIVEGARQLETVAVLPRSLPHSSAILGLTWSQDKLYVAFQVDETTEIHIYETKTEPSKRERR